MQTFLISLAVAISVLLIIVVLIQKSKGGGLASNFAGSNQIMGVRRTNNFIEKATWTLAVIVCVVSLLSGIMMRGSIQGNQPMVKDVNPIDQFPGSFDTATEQAAPEATENAVVTETEEVAVETEAAAEPAAEAATTAAE